MKIKFNILAIFSLVAFMIGSESCQKELFKKPIDALAPESAFDSPTHIEKSAIGMYSQLENAEFFGGRVLVYADIRGNDVNVPAFFGNIPLFNTVLSTDGIVSNAWAGAYRTIHECNSFMDQLAPKASLISAAKYAQYKGEAKFIRSLVYFYLVNLWAQPYRATADASQPGVPMVLNTTIDPFGAANQLPRSTVAQVYTQIESDLKESESSLPADYKDPGFQNVARATQGAAQALLMRMYLYKGDYKNASLYADKLTGGRYALNKTPETPFRTYTTSESIFSVAHNGADNPNTNNALGAHYAPDRRADISLSKSFIALMDTNRDLRYKNLVKTVSKQFWTAKYVGLTDWVPVLRYPEILLTKAEALANLSTTPDPAAITLIQQVRNRSNGGPLPTIASQQDLISAVLKERKIELAFEGQGSFDYLRTGRDIPAHGVVGVQAYKSTFTVLPIPFYDLQKNPSLTQNSGY